MEEDFSDLAPILAEIAEVAGRPAALAIQKAHGGCALYFPEQASDDHWLTQCVGREAADKIVARFCRCQVTIPAGERSLQRRARRRAIELIEAGADRNAVAREAGLHVRTVSRISNSLSSLKERKD